MDHQLLDTVFSCCCSLTNFDLEKAPLRKNEYLYYRVRFTEIEEQVRQQKENRNEIQRNYRKRLRERINNRNQRIGISQS